MRELGSASVRRREPITLALVDALAPTDPRLRVVDVGAAPQVAVVGAHATATIERLTDSGTAVLAVARDPDIVLDAVRAGAAGCVIGRVSVDAVLRTAAGEAVFSAGLAERVLEATGRDSVGRAGQPLTDREVDVLALVVEGMTGRQIAARLVLSPRTVENHVQRLLRKLGQPNRAALVRFALEHGLVR